MYRRWLAMALVGVMGACTAQRTPPSHAGEAASPSAVAAADPETAVVRVVSRSGRTLGVGFVTTGGQVVTGLSVFEQAPEAWVLLASGQRLQVTRVGGSNRQHNLVVLGVDWGGSPPPGLVVAPELPRPGTPITLLLPPG